MERDEAQDKMKLKTKWSVEPSEAQRQVMRKVSWSIGQSDAQNKQKHILNWSANKQKLPLIQRMRLHIQNISIQRIQIFPITL